MLLGAVHHGGVYCKDIGESIAWYEMLGFRLLFRTDAMEDDKPLKMAWVKAGDDIVLELLEQEDKATVDAAARTQNHIALRVADIEAVAQLLRDNGVAIEAGPFETELRFDRPLQASDAHVFETYGDGGLKLKIMFFRGLNGERFEVVQDNLGKL